LPGQILENYKQRIGVASPEKNSAEDHVY